MRRALTGGCFGTVGALIAISPLGRLSGAHINPAVSLLGNWSIAAGKERVFRYGILLYRGPGRAETLDRQFKAFAASRAVAPREGPAK